MGESAVDDELYEMVLAEFHQVTADILVATALLPTAQPQAVSALARQLVAAEDSRAAFLNGPSLLWLVNQAVERKGLTLRRGSSR